MNTTDIIYLAVNSIKSTYAPAKHLHIEELSGGKGCKITARFSGIEEGYESDVLDAIIESIHPVVSRVSSEAGDKIGEAWFVCDDDNNKVEDDWRNRTVTYTTYAWFPDRNCADIDTEHCAESKAIDNAYVILELFSIEELEDETKHPEICKNVLDIVMVDAEPINNPKAKQEFVELAVSATIEHLEGFIENTIEYSL